MGSRNRQDARLNVAEPVVHRWTASDGVDLAYRETGTGRPVVLLHGLFSDPDMNWIKFGHAERIAAAGLRVIMPDLRAHGLSARPQEASLYPRGILARDLRELIAHLGLSDFDLGGFSLGARTTVEGVGEGLKPRRAILGGAGLQGLQQWERRKLFFLEAIARFDQVERGDPHWLTVQFMKSQKVDRIAAAHLLESFADARLRAIREARSIMSSEVAAGKLCLSCHICVEDAQGATLLTVPFSEALEISGL